MSKRNNLLHDTILYAIANFGSVALNFLLLPFYTRYFTPEQFGTWDIAMTTIALLTPIVTLELTSATYRWLIEANKQRHKQTIITSGLIQISKQLGIINIIAIIMFLWWPFPWQWLMLGLLNVSVVTNFLLQCTRALKRNVLFASLSLLQTIIVITVTLSLLLLYTFGIEAFFYAHIIANIAIVAIIVFTLPLHQYIAWHQSVNGHGSGFSRTLLRKYFTYAIPIIPAAISWWMMTMSDRWMIALFLGVSANGIYAIAIKIPAVLLMINTIFSLAWKDRAILTFKTKEKNEYFSLVFKYYFRLLSISVIGLTLLAKPIIHSFIGEAYADAWKYSGILLIGALFHSLALFWSAGFHGAKETRAILRSSIVGAIVNVVVSLLLIPFLGLYGIAISSTLAFLTTWIMRVQEAKGHFHIHINKIEVTVFMIVIVITNFVVWLT